MLEVKVAGITVQVWDAAIVIGNESIAVPEGYEQAKWVLVVESVAKALSDNVRQEAKEKLVVEMANKFADILA